MPDNVVENYGWSSSNEICSHGYISPEVIKLIKRFNPKKIIDIGCGNGFLCSQIHQEGYNVVGVEYDSAGYEIASSNNKELNFYNLGVYDDPSVVINNEGLFDVVVSTEVVEHLFSPHMLPQFSSKVLNKGGYLIITTPYHGYLKNLVLSLLNMWDKHHTPLWHGGHIKFWSRNTLSLLLAENGFKTIDFIGVGRAPYLWKSMILVAQKV